MEKSKRRVFHVVETLTAQRLTPKIPRGRDCFFIRLLEGLFDGHSLVRVTIFNRVFLALGRFRQEGGRGR